MNDGGSIEDHLLVLPHVPLRLTLYSGVRGSFDGPARNRRGALRRLERVPASQKPDRWRVLWASRVRVEGCHIHALEARSVLG